MAKRKKPVFKMKAQYGYISFIAVCAILCIKMVAGDIAHNVQETGLDIEDTPLGGIVSNIQDVGDAAANAEEFQQLQSLDFGGTTAKKTTTTTTVTTAVQTTARADDSDISELPSIVQGKKYEAAFVRAKDGDTYVVSSGGQDRTVRLIGVDTPESVAPSTYDKENTEEGKTVSDIVKGRFSKGDKVYLEFDAAETDKYGRLLAYVYFADGTMVQDWLLMNGYARVMTVQPNSRYAEHFVELEQEAAKNEVGLWKGYFTEE